MMQHKNKASKKTCTYCENDMVAEKKIGGQYGTIEVMRWVCRQCKIFVPFEPEEYPERQDFILPVRVYKR